MRAVSDDGGRGCDAIENTSAQVYALTRRQADCGEPSAMGHELHRRGRKDEHGQANSEQENEGQNPTGARMAER